MQKDVKYIKKNVKQYKKTERYYGFDTKNNKEDAKPLETFDFITKNLMPHHLQELETIQNYIDNKNESNASLFINWYNYHERYKILYADNEKKKVGINITNSDKIIPFYLNVDKIEHITILHEKKNTDDNRYSDVYNNLNITAEQIIKRINNKDFKNLKSFYYKFCNDYEENKDIFNILQDKIKNSGTKAKIFVSTIKPKYKAKFIDTYYNNGKKRNKKKILPDNTDINIDELNKNKYKYFDYYCVTQDKIYKVPYNLVKNRVDLIDNGKFDKEFNKATKMECEIDNQNNIIEKQQPVQQQINQLQDGILNKEDKQNLKYLHECENKIKHFRTDKSRYNDALISLIKTANKQDLKTLYEKDKQNTTQCGYEEENENVAIIYNRNNRRLPLNDNTYEGFIAKTLNAIKTNEFDNGWGRNSILKKKLKNVKPENTIEVLNNYIKSAETVCC